MIEAHSAVEHQFSTAAQQRGVATLGMWLFLATEIMVFGALIGSYLTYRAIYPEEFEAVSGRLNVLIGGVNTLVLLTSSLTMALAVYAIQVGKRQMVVWCLALTALLGCGFLGFKAVEYYGDYVERLVPLVAFDPADWIAAGLRPERIQLALTFYYFMTLLHALHLIVGIALILILMLAVLRGAVTQARPTPVEIIGLYWHFVDVVWIFLLPLLYLLGTHTHL